MLDFELVSTVAERGLEALLEAVTATGRTVEAAWVFGSHARGDARVESDLDLAVLATPELGEVRMALMDRIARTLDIDVDLIDMRIASPVLAWEVITTGQLVYERDDAVVEDFVRKARFAAEDQEQRDRMVLLAQVGQVGGSSR